MRKREMEKVEERLFVCVYEWDREIERGKIEEKRGRGSVWESGGVRERNKFWEIEEKRQREREGFREIDMEGGREGGREGEKSESESETEKYTEKRNLGGKKSPETCDRTTSNRERNARS
jgi:hypothetical protein